MLCCKKGNHNDPSNNSNEEQCNHNAKSHKFHMLIMLLCCALPILLIGLLPTLGIGGGNVGKLASYLMIILCPLSHIFMMKGMFKSKKE